MYKWVLLSVLMLLGNTAAAAPKLTYLEEIFALGSVAGQGLACRSPKYDQFELLARAIMIGKAANGEMQKQGIEEYNAGKVEAFMNIEAENFASCGTILKEFERQKIFSSVLYSDGRIKLYDGTMITPRNPYDASKLYQKDPQAFEKAHAAYKKSVAKAKENAKNAKKIPLMDPNYSKYAQ